MSTKPSGKYVPPIKRASAPAIPEKIDFSDKNFPTLGVSSASTPKVQVGNLSDLIKEKIHKDELLELEKLKDTDIDVRDMTREQFLADGGVVLKIDRSKRYVYPPDTD